MKQLVKLIILVIFVIINLTLLFLLAAIILEYRPDKTEPLEIQEPQRQVALVENDTVSILCWNIGFCGLGKDMDFILDGGKKTRSEKQDVTQNLEAVIRNIKSLKADIILLQEVETKSKRSYRTNQQQTLIDSFPEYYSAFAYNFKTFFVPIPFYNPLGSVNAGLMALSRFKPKDANRIQYPISSKFPYRLFDLKRALLSFRIEVDGTDIIVANTHNSAYDNGLARMQENQALCQILSDSSYSKYNSIIAGDWNQLPPNYKLSDNAASDKNYRPIDVDPDFMKETHRWIADTSKASMRYLDKAFKGDGSDKTAITDFFLVSNDVQVISVETIDLQFENSDHQPVLLKVIL